MLRAKAAPLARKSLSGVERSVGKACAYARSVVARMTVKERLLVLFAFGLVIGFGIKTAATGTITIGYLDYSLKTAVKPYDLNEIQRRVAEKSLSGAAETDQAVTPSGGSCR